MANGLNTSSDAETERIRRVYTNYAEDPRSLAKWDARNPGNVRMWEEFTTAMSRLFGRENVQLEDAMMLDVGCGLGSILGWLSEQGAGPEYLYGIDLLENRIAQARLDYPDINFSCADARHLAFPNHLFDVVLCINLFSSILDHAVAEAVALELLRVVKPSGVIVWCDIRYRNPWNSNVRSYTRGEMRALFPGCQTELRSITVAPQLARRLGAFTAIFYPLLARIPFLRVRYLGVIRPNAASQ